MHINRLIHYCITIDNKKRIWYNTNTAALFTSYHNRFAEGLIMRSDDAMIKERFT